MKAQITVETLFDSAGDSPCNALQGHYLRTLLLRLLPEEEWEAMAPQLPLLRWSFWGSYPQRSLSLYFLCAQRPGAGKFFYDLVSRVLLPTKRIAATVFFSIDFRVGQDRKNFYTLTEMGLSLHAEQDLDWVKLHLSILEEELQLGMVSLYHAARLLEVRGLFGEGKTAAIQRDINSLLQRRPLDLDYDLLREMHHFLATASEQFIAMRETRHVSRLICMLHIFQQSLCRQQEFPHLRHLHLKIGHTRIHLPWGVKKVLSLFVGINFLKEGELFEEEHLIKACRSILPTVSAVGDTYFLSEQHKAKRRVVYLEIEKSDGKPFSAEEVGVLRGRLPEELHSAVEQWTRPLFMPRNEEEVLRNILILSHQLKYARDLPQAILSFDGQNEEELSFTVILLRVLHDDSSSVEKLFAEKRSPLRFVPDRVRHVGLLRGKYPKEATVFRVKLPAASFLRRDHSVDLFAARREVLKHLHAVLGEVRDYNGGMFAKQNEVLFALKEALGPLAERHELLVENFFHAIFPIEMRSTLSKEPLKEVFLLLLEQMEKNQILLHKETPSGLFAVALFSQQIHPLLAALQPLQLGRSQLFFAEVKGGDHAYLALILFSEESPLRAHFLAALLRFLQDAEQ